MKPVRVSRANLLGVYASGMLTALVLFGCGAAAVSLEDPDLVTPGGSMLLAGLLMPALTCALVLAVLVHRMWKSLQFAGAGPTPGKAVGLCFVPFFNLYWFFRAIGGWAGAHNRVVTERRLGLRQMPEGLTVVVAVMLVLCVVPYCQAIPMLALTLVLVPMLVWQVSGHVNALADAVERGLPQVPADPAGATVPVQAESPAEAPASPPRPPAPAAETPGSADTAAGTRVSVLAIVSLAISALGLCTAGLGGLVGLPLGFVAWLRIRKPENRLRGGGLAVAGMIVGAVALILGLLVMAIAAAAAFAHQPTRLEPRAPAAPASRPAPEPAPAHDPE